MKYEDDEDVLIIPKYFEGLDECYRYYIGIIHFLKERLDHDEDINKREFKYHRNLLMKQLKANIKLLKMQDTYSRKQEADKLKPSRTKQAEETAKQHFERDSQYKQKQALEGPQGAQQLPPTQQEEVNADEIED